jgi:hypothetical protein
VIDDEHGQLALLRLEFESQLFLHSIQKRKGATRVRCRYGAARTPAGARVSAQARADSLLELADRAENHGEVPGSVDFGGIDNRSMDVPRGKTL